jgi:hypothetical protein
MKAEILGVRFVHEGWSRFGIATVRLADGAVVEREIEDHGNSVGVLPYDPERKVATLVRELRVPPLFAAGEQVQLEAPAGLIDAEAGGGAEGEHENIRIVEMPLAELARMADRAELTDLKTLTLVLALRARHPELFAA